MNTRRIALCFSLAAIASLLAGCAVGTVEPTAETEQAIARETVTSQTWTATTHVLVGTTASGANESLHHVSTTGHTAIGNPDLIPAGACRDNAVSWNAGVAQGQSSAWFETLIAAAASSSCDFAVAREDAANRDGSYDLAAMSPSP